MNEWLKDFAYHIQINWTVFLFVTMLVLTLAILTMGVQSIKAAMTNPLRV
jgi:putative ABC transport system permease protein